MAGSVVAACGSRYREVLGDLEALVGHGKAGPMQVTPFAAMDTAWEEGSIRGNNDGLIMVNH